MKKRCTLIFMFVLMNTIFGYSQEKSDAEVKGITTYYLVRHAEKDRTTKTENPILSEKGKERAENWERIFKTVSLDAVYSTDYIRTKETVGAIATSHNLKIQIYDPATLKIEDFKLQNFGKTVLIAGHSNTNPQFVNKLIGTENYKDMADDDNGSMYIVTICGTESNVQILKID